MIINKYFVSKICIISAWESHTYTQAPNKHSNSLIRVFLVRKEKLFALASRSHLVKTLILTWLAGIFFTDGVSSP